MILKLSLLRWCATLVGVQMLCGVLWVLGPLLPALDPWPARAALAMALLLVWAAANLLLDFRRTQREAELTQGLTGAAADESAAVGAKLATALTLMRKAKGRKFTLYEQPWYAIIGPPGAGKTTALLNAGLNFPLTDQLGPGAIAGVGGTRLCDWWFTDQAVLIDTAGRYTTQDSNRDVDRAGWDAFLTLLRRTRPKQPLNGVIVAIALSDVAGASAAMLDAHAAAIRSRIDELEEKFGLRMPVYALFTKADLLIGFCEFFDDLDRTAREQVWGATFPLKGTPDVTASLRPLRDRLDRRVFQRLDAEENADRRALIAGFPAQLASTVAPLQLFVAKAFGADAAGKSPLLRGLYFASGTQEGTPIDRLVGALSRSFHMDQRRADTLRPTSGRSYFLTALLRDVIFKESMLVVHRPGAERRRRLVRAAGFAACGVITIGAAALLGMRYTASQAAITQTAAALAGIQTRAAGLVFNPVGDADVARLVPWLDAAGAAASRVAPPRDPLGFAQDTKLIAAAQQHYREALDYALLPRLVWRAETQMRGALGQADALYEATRVYLMLGGEGPLDPALIQDWFTRDWAATYPGDDQSGLRSALGRHLTALLTEPLPAMLLDGPLVAAARRTIGQVPLASRAYSRLKALVAEHSIPPWRPSDALGPAGIRIFVRLSGRGLEEGIPGLYTIAGFRDAVLPALPRAAEQAAAEGWVLGEPIAPDSAKRRSLDTDIIGLYAAEYAAAWDAMLADLDPAPLRSLTQAAQDLYILASPHSPIRSLVESVAKQVAPGAAAPAAYQSAMAMVDQRFQPLRALLGTGGAAAIDQILRPLGDLQQQLAKQFTTAAKIAAPAVGEDPAAALRAEALRQPQPLARWLVALATGGVALRDGGPQGAMITAWNATGGGATLCPAVLANHYPFVPAAAADAPLADFIRLLGPGGVIDAFFNSQLKPYVDMKAKPWKLQQLNGVSAPLNAADLAQFQRASEIRDMFFPAGSAQPLVRFDVTPGALDPPASAATLDLGGTPVTAVRDATARPAAQVWPPRTHPNAAHLTIEVPAPGTPLQIDTDGPWAVFRLLARAHVVTTGERMALTFNDPSHGAHFELRVSPNPFASTALSEFRCPTVQ